MFQHKENCLSPVEPAVGSVPTCQLAPADTSKALTLLGRPGAGGLGCVSRSPRDGKFRFSPSLSVSGYGVLTTQCTGWKCLRVVINLPLAGVRRREGQMVYVISSWAVWEMGEALCGKETSPFSVHTRCPQELLCVGVFGGKGGLIR